MESPESNIDRLFKAQDLTRVPADEQPTLGGLTQPSEVGLVCPNG